MVVTQEQQLNNVMQSGLSWNVGSGDKIKFWEDCWNGEGVVLMQKIPRLYQISRQQHNLIQQVGSFSDTSWEWNLTWRRQIIGVPTYHVQTRSSLKTQGHIALISEIEPKHIDDAMQDNNWTEAIFRS